METDNFDNSDEVYFFMDEPQLKQIDIEELEKEHGDEDPASGDEAFCLNDSARDWAVKMINRICISINNRCNLACSYCHFREKGIASAAGIVFNIFVIIVVSVYILLERKDIKSFVQNLLKATVSEEKNKKIAEIYESSNFIFYNYITSQILDGFIVGVIVSIIMSIMKIKYGVLLGFMIGLFNIIPYFGAIVAIIIASVITIFTGGLAKALWMTLIIIIVQQVDANIINPRILGTSLKISPILVIFSTTVGGAYFGVIGMFLGVPVAALAKIFLMQYIKHKNEEKKEDEA